MRSGLSARQTLGWHVASPPGPQGSWPPRRSRWRPWWWAGGLRARLSRTPNSAALPSRSPATSSARSTPTYRSPTGGYARTPSTPRSSSRSRSARSIGRARWMRPVASATAVDDTRTDLESAARSSVIRGFAFALGAVLLVALVLWLLRSRWRHLGFAAFWVAGVGVVATVGSLLLAVVTFDAKAFTTPSYYGRGPELAQLLAFFERQQDNDRYSATFDNALTNFSAYLGRRSARGRGRRPRDLLRLGPPFEPADHLVARGLRRRRAVHPGRRLRRLGQRGRGEHDESPNRRADGRRHRGLGQPRLVDPHGRAGRGRRERRRHGRRA